MGLLSLGTPLSTHGITQFLNIWDRLKDRCGDELLWGDEIEYLVVSFDNEGKNAKLSLRQTEILAKLATITNDIASARGESASVPTFHPEYGRFMLESTRDLPTRDLCRTSYLSKMTCDGGRDPYTLTSFPRLGVPGVFTDPYFDPADAESSHSLFLPEEITNPHARCINLPLYIDSRTPRPFVDPTIPWQRNLYPEDPGTTALALTAASPLFRGYIADVDCRWDVIRQEERGLNLSKNRYRIPKSRYSSVSLYISDDWMHRPEYDDIDAPYDQAIFDRLQKHGIDNILARHISHLFIRDPINIQSTNWQTVRFKPPPFRSMEVQMTDFENAAFSIFVVLLSRAILAFNLNLYLPISRVNSNLALCERSTRTWRVRRSASRAHGEVLLPQGRVPAGCPSRPESRCSSCSSSGASSPVSSPVDGTPRKEKKLRNCWPSPVEDEYEEMSLQEIIAMRSQALWASLCVPRTLDIEEEERVKLERYLDLVKRRTDDAATWLREFVRSHPAYKFDSVVSQEINYDLFVAVDEIERGVRDTPDFLPHSHAKR
ncbi:glutamate-cysteine ligase-domain-containing protein [Fomitopsis serialis]|uniref:glutamate-cysteine ligase-domain-containing protein n=1 Tax=Fomitopsis serialis TaxID=139415 RepID=UPI0020072D70|nr:glutamate-cysteine ligase-domain-containing protein [Neoantrodia serialis]KAH9935686.1 glutamate-cysteine ligase-domain-containing protein [Neoantrodia serialis]